jgi:hypothetical protein
VQCTCVRMTLQTPSPSSRSRWWYFSNSGPGLSGLCPVGVIEGGLLGGLRASQLSKLALRGERWAATTQLIYRAASGI